MKADAFKKFAVVSVETDAKLGYVDDLLFDTDSLRVAVLRVKGDNHSVLVPWSEIKNVGPDAITVPTDAAAHTPSAESILAALPSLDGLRKRKAVDEGGTLVGTVKELDIDSQSGAISQIEMHTGGVVGIGGTTTIHARDIRSIGDDVLMITAMLR